MACEHLPVLNEADRVTCRIDFASTHGSPRVCACVFRSSLACCPYSRAASHPVPCVRLLCRRESQLSVAPRPAPISHRSRRRRLQSSPKRSCKCVSILAQGLHSAERHVQQSDASAPLCADRSVLAAASAGRRVTVPEAALWRDVCGHWRVSRHRAPERPACKGCAWAAAFARSSVALERMEARGGFLPKRESAVSPRYTALCDLWRRHVRLA